MSIRAEKVASVIKRCISQPLSDMAREHSAGLVTLTAVRLSTDLQQARVYISVFGGKSTPMNFLKHVEDRKGELRYLVGKTLKLRFTPELKFFIDDTLDQMEKIQTLIDSVKKSDSETHQSE